MAEKRVIVYRTSDPIQADMLGALLRENGIAACVLGTRHGAGIGVGQHILDLYIEVPHAHAGPATDFLEAFFESDGAALLAEHAGFAPEDDEPEDDADAQNDDRHGAQTNDSRDAGAGQPAAGRRRGARASLSYRLAVGALLVAVSALLAALFMRALPGGSAQEPVPAAQPAH